SLRSHLFKQVNSHNRANPSAETALASPSNEQVSKQVAQPSVKPVANDSGHECGADSHRFGFNCLIHWAFDTGFAQRERPALDKISFAAAQTPGGLGPSRTGGLLTTELCQDRLRSAFLRNPVGAGEKVVAVARASLVAGKEDRISALPSPQGSFLT
ncbi:unnamed protein product, partial [Dovyalis caffra]